MTDVSSLIADMVRAGVDPELIGRTAAALANAPTVIQKTARQERNARYYSRKTSEKRLNSDDQDVSDATDANAPLPSPVPLSSPPTPPPIIPQTPSIPSNKRGTRLPDDWVLPAKWGQWAIDQGHPEASIRVEAQKFLNHWTSKSGKDASKLNWERTWHNWMLNVPKGRPPSQAPPKRERSILDVIDERLEQQNAEQFDSSRTIDHEPRGNPSPVVHLFADATRYRS